MTVALPHTPDRARLGVLVFLATEVMFFAGLFSALVVLSPVKSMQLDVALASAMTAMLVGSSVALHVALLRRTAARAQALLLAFGALLLGALFLATMTYEWSVLLTAGHLPATDLWHACFYVLTGVHGLHVLVGVLWLAAGWVGLARGSRGRALELGALYWHFVDAVWLLLFWKLYLA